MERYSVIHEKRPREIVLLRGSGCFWKRCSFCDYHQDSSPDAEENFRLNQAVLEQVSGLYGDLEVINSGSVFELDSKTLACIRTLCSEKNISTLHFESHYLYRDRLPTLREFFSGIQLRMKLGLETFDRDFRETVLKKGIPESDPAQIAAGFQEANLLFGLTGQTYASMKRDLELGLAYFDRICVNMMCRNSTSVLPDAQVAELFMQRLYPLYRDNPRVDILLNNTDFGVGE